MDTQILSLPSKKHLLWSSQFMTKGLLVALAVKEATATDWLNDNHPSSSPNIAHVGDFLEDEHDVVRFWLEVNPHECPVCFQYFAVKVISPGGPPLSKNFFYNNAVDLIESA
ncbi:hypothetical protein HPP92_019729 [Vanilla planifolia]|uniref:Uncharacterized protein n=1 Tax=Vanilla planifolia TaxID=51239 RepID=A0A835UM11_VANPL|nr:hypothetical protein HPP92_019729 [Vanilla planifolia]